MTDEEIKQYLEQHDYAVLAQDGIMDILNTSRQIIKENYDFKTSKMTLTTPYNTFIFDWVLNKIS